MKEKTRSGLIAGLAAATLISIAATATPPAVAQRPTPVTDEWAQINSRLDELDKAIADKDASIEAVEAEIASATAQIADLDAQIAAAEKDMAATNAEVETLRSQVRRRSIAAFTGNGMGEYSSYEPEVFQEQSSRSVFMSALSVPDSELIDALNAKKAQAEAEQKAINSQRGELNATMMSLSASREGLRSDKDELDRQRKEARAQADRLAVKFGTNTGPVGSGSICSAAGIQVHCSIAPQVQRMVAAASADGVRLSGGGYRDSAGQIALRIANCGGNSNWNIYGKSPSECRPATARPGQSMHERGLAIDFDNCGGSSACYGWMKRNGAAHGFFNLPGESWHWSTSGT